MTTAAPLTYLEFYSGIGGWGMALEDACVRISSSSSSTSTTTTTPTLRVKRLAAFDIQDTAMEVLHHNFPPAEPFENNNNKTSQRRRRRYKPTDIGRLSPQNLERYHADIWVMSPPCQPHTRQNDKSKDDDDPRSKSFLHLCQVLTVMEEDCRPHVIGLENVIGFEESNCCKIWREALSNCGYSVGHFRLSPPQVGIPNDRPRYYCIAVLLGNNNTNNNKPPSPQKQQQCDPILRREYFKNQMKLPPIVMHHSIPSCYPHDIDSSSLPTIAAFLDDDLNPFLSYPINDETTLDKLKLPLEVLKKPSSWCLDIVTPYDTRSSCFTHSYGRFLRGTGSVLYIPKQQQQQQQQQQHQTSRSSSDETTQLFQLEPPDERTFDPNWVWNKCNFETHDLRYFSGTEMARLMGFPFSERRRFEFPSNCSSSNLKQQWKLLGNSLNVKVASYVAEIGIRHWLMEGNGYVLRGRT